MIRPEALITETDTLWYYRVPSMLRRDLFRWLLQSSRTPTTMILDWC